MSTPDLGRLGVPGVVGIGLLLFCASFYFGSVAPMQDELRRVDRQAMRLAQRTTAIVGGVRSDLPVVPPPPFRDAPDLLKNLNAAAERHGVQMDHASYRLVEAEGQRKIEVSLPFKTSYPALRDYLRDIFASAPAASLDELSLHRAHANDAAIDADLRLSYYFQ